MSDSRRHFRCFYIHPDGTLLTLDFLAPNLDAYMFLRNRIRSSLPKSFDWCLEIDDLFDEDDDLPF